MTEIFKVSGFRLMEYDGHYSIEIDPAHRIGKANYNPANRRRTNPYGGYDQYNRFDTKKELILGRLRQLVNPSEVMSWEAYCNKFPSGTETSYY